MIGLPANEPLAPVALGRVTVATAISQ